ncbi:galectin-3-like isoform X2 [Micropterus dolomieu]|uniref:galectin-3-like isoform X2 n=1 Tax=Micropterus dolomieu TaxID=147949 RepID=UPI001E8D4229|nr:galectin-3-like isoform X2 [Micropterus dolomieu]
MLRSQSSRMDLSDALGDWPAGGNSQSLGETAPGPWPGQPANPAWPGQPAANPAWPGQPAANPAWPGQPAANPAWPGQPAANPTWPGGPSVGGGAWPGGPSPQPIAPGGWPSPSPGPGPGVPAAPQQSLVVPYKQTLPSGVYDKLLITIAGTIKPNANKITVDLNTDQDLAFHFNPRFNEDGKKVIVRNSCIGKNWGREERELQQFPFVPGQPFEMKIMCTNKEFKVAVNNTHLLTFQHRVTNLRAINQLSIYYDLTLSRVNMETLP